jgi:predicted dehydrogenase
MYHAYWNVPNMIHHSVRHRIGIIGAGARAETFARQLHEGHPSAVLHSICDVDADRLDKFYSYCGIESAPRFTDLDAFLAQRDLVAVIITTPDWTHEEVATAALRAGVHIYLEKPMAQSAASCRQIMREHLKSDVTAFIGFNLRQMNAFMRLKSIVDSGVLGQIVHISGLEQLTKSHAASFMRRYHRKSELSGGLINHKCSHDLDILQWLIGHEHKIVRVSSFGGTNVFTPDKQPAKRCSECDQINNCSYSDKAGFVFPVVGDQPIHHKETHIYGGDQCAYNDDKDAVDNQTIILEWDNGVRGNFNLQMFQFAGRRQTCIWGEKGYAEMNTWPKTSVKVVDSSSGETTEYSFKEEPGGHGGSDARMISRFVEAIGQKSYFDSGLTEGLAATLIAEKAEISRLTGETVQVSAEEYEADYFEENLEPILLNGFHQ